MEDYVARLVAQIRSQPQGICTLASLGSCVPMPPGVVGGLKSVVKGRQEFILHDQGGGGERVSLAQAPGTRSATSGIGQFVTLLCAWIRTRGEQRMIAAKLGEFYAAHPSVDRSVLPANKKLEYLCGHADARGRLKFQPDPNVSGGGWLEIVTSPEPTFSPSTDTASMAAFHRVLRRWIYARGGSVHAAGMGPFYVEHPEFEEAQSSLYARRLPNLGSR